jgi:hypothetical protein
MDSCDLDIDTLQPTPSPDMPDMTSRSGLGNIWRTAALLCAVALLWLATRPYFGTVFDARFYMLEALNELYPARFAQDLYFKFGSQGNFSVFTKLYQPLLPVFGVGTTGIILTIAGQLLWVFALFRLARSLVGERIMWLSVAVVIGILQVYAGGFGYGESYATARLFAEAFVMLGLALLPSHKPWAVALLVLSAALHPLMALPGIAVALVYLALGQPIWWAVMAAGAGLVSILGVAHVEPFSNLFRTMDPEWFAVIKVREIHCLLTLWPAEYFVQMSGVLAWAIAAVFAARPSQRRFLIAALLVGVGGLVVAFLGGDLAHNVLIVELQPWRSMWLLQLVSRIYVPLVLAALFARTSFDSFRSATLLALGLVLASSVARVVRNPNAADFTVISLALVTAALAVMAAHLLLVEQKHRRIALISALAGFALIPVALARWDARSPWILYLESPEPPPKDLAALLPSGASVYWESGLEMLWLRLKRPSYFSCDQGTGALFYRDTAMAYKRRASSFWPLRIGDFNQLDTCVSLDTRPKPERNRKGLQNLCAREPGLDYVILAQPLDGVTPKVWKSPVRFQDLQSSAGKFFARVTDRFYIYSCGEMRQMARGRQAGR